MTDKNIADKTYIEPLTVESLEAIIKREKPDGVLAGFGGQTGLNLAMELNEMGVFKKYNGITPTQFKRLPPKTSSLNMFAY